jgi:uncharacterized protein YyaL (SSP411 family)
MTTIEGHGNGNEQIRRLAEVDRNSLPSDGGPHFNRLIFAKSPYLLQHAENPVDWFPWGEEAFAKAKREDKPVFLSIGYATCHWCHVMERESFEDHDVAAVLNERYVAVKVDREERPDIDDQYMTVAQMMTGGGGWPLTIVMTPDKEPFFAATYLPKSPTKDMAGIIEVLKKIDDFWRNNRDEVEESCSKVLKNLAATAVPSAGPLEADTVADGAFRSLKMAYDGISGGFGEAPKFPLPHYISFLLRYWKRHGATIAGNMAEHTLSMIRNGGIFDQVGLGLHRYAVDRKWLVPHFEKMLYDQAMAAHACLDACQATGEDRYAAIAEEIFEFVLNELRSPQGGFYSAWDADTDGKEGEFYTWTISELEAILGHEAASSMSRLYGITGEGNFEGRNILSLQLDPELFAAGEGVDPATFRATLEGWRRRLLAARERRPRPLRDEKILTSWNGLMISALAKGYAVTGVARYREAADAAAAFIRGNLLKEGGRLLRSWYRGEAEIPAFLEDYAFFVWGLIELYEATLDPSYLDEARNYSRKMIRLFQDNESYGLFDTASDAENVLVRKKGGHDGVIPSGNAVAAMNLIRLGRISGDEALLEEGKGILRAFMGSVAGQPVASLHFMAALDYLNGPETEVIIHGRLDSRETASMLRAVRRRFIPGLVLRFSERNEPTTVRICAKGACRLPVAGIAELETLLDEII